MPKVLHITYSPSGGAGIAAGNLVRAISDHTNWDSSLLSLNPSNLSKEPFTDPIGTATAVIDEYLAKESWAETPISLLRRSSQFLPSDIAKVSEADVIHLHWVEGLLHGRLLEALKTRPPGTIFWTMHDMRPFTGGCHFSGECTGFQNDCSSCPIVRKGFKALVSSSLARRIDLIRELKPTMVAPGAWMAKTFSKSSLGQLPVELIPLALDARSFVNKEKSKGNGTISLGFIAANLADPRKGLELARKQIGALAGQGIDLQFQLAGDNPPGALEPWETSLGQLTERDVPSWLASLDFLVFTSINDNSPLVITESFAASTPVLLSSGTGADQMVRIGTNSLRLTDVTQADLYQERSLRRLSMNAKFAAQQHRPEIIARKITELYESKSNQRP